MENQRIILRTLSTVADVEELATSRALTDVIEGNIEMVSLSRYGLEYVAAPCAVLAWN